MSKIKPPHIYIDIVSEKIGWGVFAARSFFKDEVIEDAPVFLLEEKYSDIPKEFQNRIFRWGLMTGTSAGRAVALGYGSIYNHSDRPNVVYEADDQNKVLRFRAKRVIDPGEQLTIHYRQENDGSLPDQEEWFETEGIEKLDI
jgi:SET domain-containing protein